MYREASRRSTTNNTPVCGKRSVKSCIRSVPQSERSSLVPMRLSEMTAGTVNIMGTCRVYGAQAMLISEARGLAESNSPQNMQSQLKTMKITACHCVTRNPDLAKVQLQFSKVQALFSSHQGIKTFKLFM